jgi:hypothetical protein
MEEVKKEMSFVPSKEEVANYTKLLGGGTAKLVLVSCVFEGKVRYAISSYTVVDGKPLVEPLAVVLHENDVVWVRNEAGELLPSTRAAVPNLN